MRFSNKVAKMLSSKQIPLIHNISKFTRVFSQQVKPKNASESVLNLDKEEPRIKFKKLQLNDKLLSNLMLTV